MRMPFMLVFHQSKCISAIKRLLTRPRVIDVPRFLCNSAYLGECFHRVIGTGKWVSMRIED